MGLTCYANAVMQAFRHCKQITWLMQPDKYSTLLLKEPTPERQKQQELTATFADVVQLLSKCGKGQSVRPADFWRRFHRCIENTGFDHLAIKMPHDSHEFYLCLLDILHESLAREVDMRIHRPAPTTESEKRIHGALDTWRQEFHKKYSPLVDLFYGLMHVTVECKGCGNMTHRWETFTALKGEFPTGMQTPTLLQTIQEEMKPAEISGYHCEKCAPTRHDAVKRVSIWRLPRHLVIVLKRFTPDGRKLGNPITPLSLYGEEPISLQSLFSKDSPEKSNTSTFLLNSIVDHHGGLNGGHYTAQCRSLHQSTNWLIFDDESVQEIPHPMFGGSTYMLWFARQDNA